MRDVYEKIHDTKDIITETYGLQMVATATYTFSEMVFLIFLMIVELRQKNEVSDSLNVLPNPVIYLIKFAFMTYLGDTITEGCKNTGKILHSICARTDDSEVKTEVSGLRAFKWKWVEAQKARKSSTWTPVDYKKNFKFTKFY